MNKNILNHFFLKKYNSVAAGYTTYWRDIEKYTAMQQTKLCVTLLISIFTNLNFDTYNSLTPNWYYKVLR